MSRGSTTPPLLEGFHVSSANYNFKMDIMTGMNNELVSKQPDPQMQPTSTTAPCGDQPPAPAILDHCSTMRNLPFVLSGWHSPPLSQLVHNNDGQLQSPPGIAKFLPILRPNQASGEPQYAEDPESSNRHPRRWTRSWYERVADPQLDANDQWNRISDLVPCANKW